MCVVPEPGACSASHELPSRYGAPNTCTVHVVMHSQLRWRARAHGADRRTSGLRRLGGVCVGARRRSVARPCARCLRMGATDAFRDAHDALCAPRMHRSDAGDDVRKFRANFCRLGDLEILLYSYLTVLHYSKYLYLLAFCWRSPQMLCIILAVALPQALMVLMLLCALSRGLSGPGVTTGSDAFAYSMLPGSLRL